MLGIRISAELENKLEKLAEQTKMPKSFFVKEALGEYLEDQALYQRAISQYEEYLKKGKKTISWERIQEELGLSKDAPLED
ncbi:MAG: ribbon-helix-helix protein, CopG family [Alphaproteobacteria bacterium]|jgi:RHH-type transcriptional regulator, rel operon repressor / antitoxin RelB|nr:ribbon-helix-helix protein, CopG family [Alphaproteobacteria bacterium]MBT5390398.1 ribbon-helix-helix protein, CopG family [Alphaproteobacteria bacterium]